LSRVLRRSRLSHEDLDERLTTGLARKVMGWLDPVACG
jgi:hypothetical protein